MSRLTVQMLHQQSRSLLDLTLLAGEEGLFRAVESSKVLRPGLALTGIMSHIDSNCIQVLGPGELGYLGGLDDDELHNTLDTFFVQRPTCVVIANGLEPLEPMSELANEHRVSLFSTPLFHAVFVDRAVDYLDQQLSRSSSMHGVLVDVMGVGVLLTGPSGVGKSEVALDLVTRGHRLVADDIVELRKRPPNVVYGTPSDIIGHHMEIRGLGIINVRDLFGVTAVRQRKKIDLVVILEIWDETKEYERLGVEEQHFHLMGIPIPRIVLPLRAGRMIPTLVEVAARDRLLKDQGIHSAREFQDHLSQAIALSRPMAWGGEEVE